MKRTMLPKNELGNFTKVVINVPDTCPLCGTTIDAQFISDRFTSGIHAGIPLYTSTFLCPACDRFFHIDENQHGEYFVYPNKPDLDLDKNVIFSYPQFAEIYQQSLQAQADGLDQICGMGFRKAVERLVKDYLIRKNPNNQNDILAEALGKSISRIDNPRIQALAKASTWLGNDQVHLLKKHPDYDVESMKMFIKALVAHIELERTCEEADNFIKHQ